MLPVMLPRLLRKRLTELILDSLHDGEARRGLEAMAHVGGGSRAPARIVDLPPRALRDCFEERDGRLQVRSRWQESAQDLHERSRRAADAIRRRPLDPPGAPLGTALDAAATLFDAGLYYEVHEWLEPYWLRADGVTRVALQGLIQVAVGFEHLASGNVSGARKLLAEGCARLRKGRLPDIDLDAFERAVRACLEEIGTCDVAAAHDFDLVAVPRLPTRA
jgi:hypothetical protein